MKSPLRVLLVDDDLSFLASCRCNLEHEWEIDTARSGGEALAALPLRPYAAIVSDMAMPDMTGMNLLIEAQRLSPDTVRIMLTGTQDRKTPIDAVNTGRAFRFLTKPCTADVLISAVRAAVEQNQFALRDRELLEQTFNGAVRMLTEMLSSAAPESLGYHQRLEVRAREVAKVLEVTELWEITSAAMLFRLGMMTLPDSVSAKIRARLELSLGEHEMAQRIPEIGARLLANIPRLAPVAEIVRYQDKGFDGSGFPLDGVAGNRIPLGARILRALIDLETKEVEGLPGPLALKQLRQRSACYDPQVLGTLEKLAQTWASSEKPREEARMVAELIPDMELAKDVLNEDGARLVTAGAKLSAAMIERLLNFAELGRVRQPVFIVRGVSRGPADS